MKAVCFADIQAARWRLDGVLQRTPVMTSRTLDLHVGVDVFLKCENFQRAGAFKIRGAFNTLASLSPEQCQQGVIAYSSGNHAQALALAARLLGVPVIVVMPQDAPQVKLEATRGYGAEVVTYDPQAVDRETLTEEIRAERGLVLVPPFDHPQVVAGQGTAVWELIDQAGPLDWVVVPCGGGGLLAGTAIAAKTLNPAAKVIGVEPEGADNGNRSFRAGKIIRVERPQTFADGLKPKALGIHTFATISEHVDAMVTVSEAEIRDTLGFLWKRMKLIVEPSGAVGLTALYHGKIPGIVPTKPKAVRSHEAGTGRALGAPKRRAGVILSGGNADIGAVADWLRSGSAIATD